jgi:hypothetical protein
METKERGGGQLKWLARATNGNRGGGRGHGGGPSHKLSSFFVTINTNETNEELRPQLERAYEYFFEHIRDFISIIKAGATKSPMRETELEKIKSIDCDVASEIGGKMHKVHLHALIKIVHRTKIHLNVNRMRSFFNEVLELRGVHINSKYVAENFKNLRAYMSKTNYQEQEKGGEEVDGD